MGERSEMTLQATRMIEMTKNTTPKSKWPKKPRSEAQKEATRKMIEAGKTKRFKKLAEQGKNEAEQDKIAKAEAGKRSGEARRAYRTARETLMWANEQPLTAEEKGILLDMGFTEEQIRGIKPLDIITLKAQRMAQQGNLSAGVYVHDLIEGKIAEKHEVEVRDTTKMSVKELIAYREKLKQEEDASN